MEKRKKLIIVGGGFGGINAAISLSKAPIDILMIDKTNHHLFQPLLYQVATAALSPGNIALPIREILSKQKNTSVVMAEVKRVDLEKKVVEVGNGDGYPFDYLILAPGSRHSYFGHGEWEKFAGGLKNVDDAITIREKILLSYERAERFYENQNVRDLLRFVIIGGGPTGIEMAGAIAEIAHKGLIKNFRHIDPNHTEIYLIEAMSQLLPSFPAKLAEVAKKDLERMGIKVLLNTRVTNIDREGVYCGDLFIKTSNVIWAAGNEVPSFLSSLNVPQDKVGRVFVNPDLSIPGEKDVFVIGDAASLKDENGAPLPGVAPVAIQQGKYVASVLLDPEKRSKPFHYRDKGTMATIGKSEAVAMRGKLQFSGLFAWLAWCFIHIFYLISFPNRVLVMVQWFFLYLTNKRRVRLINRPVIDD